MSNEETEMSNCKHNTPLDIACSECAVDEMRQLVGHLKGIVAERDAQLAAYVNEMKNVEACLPHSHPLAIRAENLLTSITASTKHNAEILRAAHDHYEWHDDQACEICQAVRAKKAGE